MIKKIKCIKNIINRKCNQRDLKETYYEISRNNNRLQVINSLQNKLKKCIEYENIEKILDFNIDEINEYNIDIGNVEYERKMSCKLNPDICKINIDIAKLKLDKLNKELKEKIKLYNEDLLVLDKLKKHFLREKNSITDIYVKFARDKNNNLIALYFDIEKFVKSKSATVYLFSHEQDFLYPSKLFLRYENHLKYRPKGYLNIKDNGYALICDIKVINKRIGHGTFILSNIEPILKKVNNKIRDINRKSDYYEYTIKEIVAINGIVCPGTDTTFDDLVKFYNNNGYPTHSNGYFIYKEV